jgi:hypothetical protein
MRLPADVEMEDRLAWGLTARQLIILALAALLAYALFSAAASALPLPLAAGVAAPVGLLGVALAFGRIDGMSGDRVALAAARHISQSPRRVAAPDGPPESQPGEPPQPRVSLLHTPVRTIHESGIVECSDGSSALLLAANGTSWALRSSEEQGALAEAYGRWLNSLVEPAAIFVRSEPVDLARQAEAIEQAASELPGAALQACARTYAAFLIELASAGEGLRRRQIVLVLATRIKGGGPARAELERRAAETEHLLRAAGAELTTLDGREAAALLLDALEPPGPEAGCQLDGVVHRC